MARGIAALRPAAAIAVLAYAGLALASGLDRAAAHYPGLARWVPAPFAVQALRADARARLAAGDSGEAVLAEARLALRRDPASPESTPLLGEVLRARGDAVGADAAYRVAGTTGWRVAWTQTYWMGRALDLGDYPVAALRLDALLRQHPELVDATQVMGAFESTAPGQAALAARLAQRPPWGERYAASARTMALAPLLDRATVLASVAGSGVALGCETIAPTVGRMIELGAIPQAGALWRGHCPEARTGLVYDRDFRTASLDQDRSDFRWTFLGASDAGVSLGDTPDGSGRVVQIEANAAQPRELLRQLVLVPPGRYRLAWRAVDGDGRAAAGVLAGFSCQVEGPDWLTPTIDPRSGDARAEVTVDGSCPARWLRFGVGAGHTSATLSGISLTPLRQQ